MEGSRPPRATVRRPAPLTRAPRQSARERRSARRRRTLRRVVPLAVVALAALVAGLVVGTRTSPEERLATKFAQAWQRSDYGAMYDLIAPEDQRRVSRGAFAAAYRDAAATATATGVAAGKPGDEKDGVIAVPVTVRTRVFHTVGGDVALTFEGSDDATRVNWSSRLTFPGLRSGERLSRDTDLPARAAILASDGTPLAKGPDRTSSLPSASNIVGELGAPPASQRAELYQEGYPQGALVGITGLERVFESQVAGTPGGRLLAGRRVLARSRPRRGKAGKATIDPKLQGAAVNALAAQLGGVAVLDPGTGEVLALAGLAFSGLQPPGSTMKVVTVTAALEAKIVNRGSTFPVVTSANVGGQTISNAGGEACGGNLREVFAESCNSVFAPLGVKLGAKRLVDAAQRFGFNEPTGIPGAEVNTIETPAEMGGNDAEIGSSAIGQGKVQATALGMASVAQTIANDGVRLKPVLVKGQKAAAVRVTTPRVARKVRNLMIGVVNFGTGTSAAIPGVKVAGKTGTAELGGGLKEDAWFVAFAPARRPKLAVGVLAVQAGFGGDVAAPIAKAILEPALK
jgi:peptidoglycan glycosyltransferase